MKKKLFITTLLFFVLVFLPSCSKISDQSSNQVVIGIDSDIESLNPLFSFSGFENNISELLYLKLVQSDWDDENGALVYSPMLAKSWEWNNDSTFVTFYLRDDVLWSDSQKVTAEDVVFSYDIYSDEKIESKLYDTFNNFALEESRHIKIEDSFEIIDPYTLKINFKKNSIPSLIDVDLPIIPKHIFGKINREKFTTLEKDITPVTNGPFNFTSWDKNQSIILTANKNSFMYNPNNIQKIIFKIVPDYTSRITQLKKGEIDYMEDIRTDDIPSLRSLDFIQLSALPPREYDYIGWNNIDPEYFKKSNKTKPNKFFGDPLVRKALTFAVNRQEIIDEYLGDYGQIAFGPVSPIFRSSFAEIDPLKYNLDSARFYLSKAGWTDSNKDGVLDKNGLNFSFNFYITNGNPRREFASTLLKNNLKSIGINVEIKKMDLQVLMPKLFEKEIDAWMLGWVVGMPLDMYIFWHTSSEVSQLNFTSYSNKKVDKYLEQYKKTKSEKIKDELAKKIQSLINNDQPVTFLYWIQNLVAYNKRIQNLKITPLEPIHYCWNWTVNK
ncbi:MAG: hypothetical protein COW08_07955 [Ignavibacteriales bacterium CG12_big_fil_rev_8_21_14_0_65_30_8]|nr:MAG: hypothetical protein COW08_07955 [Ignavibacteriales bacterium CG12_big_fil_rev_8_21_14_0_65_30_8]